MKNVLELNLVEKFAQKASCFGRVSTLDHVSVGPSRVPIYGFEFGSADKTKPTFGLFGGVHGLEKIGTHLAIYFLDTLLNQLKWDQELGERLKRMRLVSIPLINPGGMILKTRSNPNGVDLMRNAPIESLTAPFLVGGHRISPWLPWYRGVKGSPLETESKALIQFVRSQMFQSTACLALDLHSGFGMKDRLWFPFAKSSEPFPKSQQVHTIIRYLTEAYLHHDYIIEAQSASYTTHGDLWDYLFEMHSQFNSSNIFIPWTLEMGSWLWIRKNIWQLFSLLGHFNPVLPHRYRRIMRRHTFLINFFFRVTLNFQSWKGMHELDSTSRTGT